MGCILSSGSKIIDFEQILRDPLNFLKGTIKNKVVKYVLEKHETRTTPVNECKSFVPFISATFIYNMISCVLFKVIFFQVKKQQWKPTNK